MTATRRILWAFCGFVGLTPAGCALHIGSTDVPSDPGDGIRVPKESQFASMVKAPGDTVSLAGPGPSVVVTATTPPPRTPGTVSPPATVIDAVPAGPAETPSDLGGRTDWPPPRQLPPLNEPFLVAARAAWDGRPDRVADALRPLDRASQDALRPLLLAGAGLALGQNAAGPKDLSVTAAQLRTALAAVERRAELKVENARLVSFAYGYRWFDALPENHVLRPGEYVYLYAEITPLAVDTLPPPGGGVGTHVAYTLRVTDAAGQPVQLVDMKGKRSPVIVFVETTEKSRGPVVEKHVSIGFAGPQTPGRYLAELEVRDQHTGRVAKQTIEFRVGGK